MGCYAASKHAIEGFCESLDHEMREFGVRAVLIEPGFTKTRIDANTAVASGSIADYAATRGRVAAGVGEKVEHGESPAVVAAVVRAALGDANPRLRYTAGKGMATLATLRRLMPPGMFDRALRKDFRVDAAR
jgi:NAD(P)-dependent dehydrogenase (short-subunit alcohol dehydrogenase family)